MLNVIEGIETTYANVSILNAVVNWARDKKYAPRWDAKFRNLLLTINNTTYKVIKYKCCKDNMVLIDIERI